MGLTRFSRPRKTISQDLPAKSFLVCSTLLAWMLDVPNSFKEIFDLAKKFQQRPFCALTASTPSPPGTNASSRFRRTMSRRPKAISWSLDLEVLVREGRFLRYKTRSPGPLTGITRFECDKSRSWCIAFVRREGNVLCDVHDFDVPRGRGQGQATSRRPQTRVICPCHGLMSTIRKSTSCRLE